jgi:hypothetical protein
MREVGTGGKEMILQGFTGIDEAQIRRGWNKVGTGWNTMILQAFFLLFQPVPTLLRDIYTRARIYTSRARMRIELAKMVGTDGTVGTTL